MPVDPNALFAAVMDGLSRVPSGIVVALLLGGPTAIYLILELGQPFDGLLQLSDKALRRALPPLS